MAPASPGRAHHVAATRASSIRRIPPSPQHRLKRTEPMLSALQTPPDPGRATPGTFREMLRRLDWRQELLSILLVLAETALVYLFIGFAMPGSDDAGSVVPAWVVVFMM